MYRIDASGSVGDLPAPATLGTEGFWSFGDPLAPRSATELDQDWFNNLQESLIRVVDMGAIAHSKSDYTGLVQAILSMKTMTDIGAVNVLAVSPLVALPAATAIVNRTEVTVIPAHTNTITNPTFAVSGGANTPIVNPDGTALAIGAIVTGWPVRLMKATGVWWLL